MESIQIVSNKKLELAEGNNEMENCSCKWVNSVTQTWREQERERFQN